MPLSGSYTSLFLLPRYLLSLACMMMAFSVTIVSNSHSILQGYFVVFSYFLRLLYFVVSVGYTLFVGR